MFHSHEHATDAAINHARSSIVDLASTTGTVTLPEPLSILPPALFVVMGALVVPFLSRDVGTTLSVGTLALAVLWAGHVPAETTVTATFLGFELVLVSVEPVTRLLVALFAGFGIAALVYASATDFDARHRSVALAYVAAAIWTVTAGDWLTVLLGWELMAVASTVLVWLYGGRAVRAGYRYALAHALGGGLFLAGIALHLGVVGVAPEALHFGPSDGLASGLPAVVGGAGIGLNAAIIGLHGWLPDTYHRPHVATSVFLCAYTTKVAVYVAYRAFPDGNLVLAYAGGVMAVYGAGYALAQKDMRRLLAYHIQAQVGYMLAGIGLGSALGVAGGFAHLFNNVLFKGLLFMVAGAIVVQTGRNRLDKFGALGTKYPVILVAFSLAALSITAVPGFNGFVSKGMVLDAATDAGQQPLELLLLAGAVGTVASFTKFGYYAFLHEESAKSEKAPTERSRYVSRHFGWQPFGWSSLPAGQTLTMLTIGVLCLGFGLLYWVTFPLLPAPDEWTADPYTSGHLLEATAILTVGILTFGIGRPLLDRLHGGVDVNRIHDPVVFYCTKSVTAGIKRGFERIDAAISTASWRAVEHARNPAETVRTLLPRRYHDAYEARQSRVPGETGLKAGIDVSLYVIVVVLLLMLGVAQL